MQMKKREKKQHIYRLPFILFFERMLRKPFTVMRGDYFKSITAGSVNECEREIERERGEIQRQRGRKEDYGDSTNNK